MTATADEIARLFPFPSGDGYAYWAARLSVDVEWLLEHGDEPSRMVARETLRQYQEWRRLGGEEPERQQVRSLFQDELALARLRRVEGHRLLSVKVDQPEPGFDGVGDFESDDPHERHLAHQAAKGNAPAHRSVRSRESRGGEGV